MTVKLRNLFLFLPFIVIAACGPPSFTPATATDQAVWAAIYLRNRDTLSVNEALRLNRLSASQNNPHGQRGLGFMYEYGIGVEKDPEEANKLYAAAAAQGVFSSEIDKRRPTSPANENNMTTTFARSANPDPIDELNSLISSDCRTRGLRQSTSRWTQCEQQARTRYAASGILNDPAAVRSVLSNHAVADSRCFAGGLQRGTNDFEVCALQARTNIRAETSAGIQGQLQAAVTQRAEADRQQAIAMAQAEAESRRRDEQSRRMVEFGLGLAAQGNRPEPSRYDGPRTITVNGNSYTCQTVGTMTNCFPLRR
jgi:TPR repeat protein